MNNESCLINPVRLAACLGGLACRVDVKTLASCDSTNAQLTLAAQQGAPTGSVLVADRQTAGRGRRGRQWLSSPDDSLTFSLLWRFSPKVCSLTGLSLVLGLALTQATDALALPGVYLKWPNDLLLRRNHIWSKLGGILVELSTDRQGTAAVIGIGLNLRAPDSQGMDFPPAGLADLSLDTFHLPERHVLLAAILVQLVQSLDQFSLEGLLPFRAAWAERNAFADAEVRLLQDAVLLAEGRCIGIDEEGALLLETAHGVERAWSGDVSLRLPC